MQVTQTIRQAAPQSQPEPLKTYRADPPSGESFATIVSGTPEGDARAVFQKYSLRSISPRQIDQMAAELRDAGYADTGMLLMLETHGETWAKQTQKTMEAATGETASPERRAAFNREMTQPINLVQQLFDQAEAARKRGDPSAAVEQMARNFEWIENMMHGAQGRGASHPAVAQSLAEAQMNGA